MIQIPLIALPIAWTVLCLVMAIRPWAINQPKPDYLDLLWMASSMIVALLGWCVYLLIR